MKKLLLVLVVVAGAGLAWTYKMKSDSAYSLDDLNGIATGANKSLPAMMDEATRLDRVVAQEGVLEKQYTLVSTRRADIDTASFEKQMSESLVAQSCANEQSRKLYKAGVSEWFTYVDMNGETIATFKIGKADCPG
jgi:hypothetical protein